MYNVFIRPLKIEDSNISWQWRNDAKIWKYTGARPDKEINYEIEKEWLLKVLVDTISKRFAIIVDNVYVGNIQLTNLTSQDAQYHIFIGDKKYWGKGIAQLATYQILTYAKETLHLKEVHLQVNIANRTAVHVYEKCGFEKNQEVEENLKMICLLETLQQPTVSVFCMVYNHEKYIAECLNGLLMQKCNFNYVIVLGEDCSRDSSRVIILDYVKKFPGKFKLLLHHVNIGAHKNQDVILKNCHGKYIAICEGDDYWTDPLKLQKQVEFLEKYSEFNIVTSKFKLYYQNTGIFKNSREVININKDLFLKDYLSYNFSHTSTFLFRNNFTIPIWFKDVHAGDQSIVIVAAGNKKIKYMDEFLTVYRINDFSVSNNVNADKSREKTFYFLSMVNKYTNGKYSLLIEYRKMISNVAYRFEKTNNRNQKTVLRYSLFIMRWFGCNVLVKFLKQ